MKKILFLLVILPIPSLAEPHLISFKEGLCLSDPANYSLWYGCSPTSAGMMLSWYDRHGFPNLVPGGDAELSTFGYTDSRVNGIIASPGHINDFFRAPFGFFKDDAFLPTHDFDCLADFMGTSQDVFGNKNGETQFHFWTDNRPCKSEDLIKIWPYFYYSDGMCGMGRYVKTRGYNTPVLYNQLIYGYNGVSAGFSFEQLKNEIDNNRGVLLHLGNEFGFGHTMYAYGYEELDNSVLVFDTLNPLGQNPGRLIWGESYFYYGMTLTHFGITVMQVSVPEPASFCFFFLASAFIFKLQKKSPDKLRL